jgi:hypothetical protein
VLLWGPLYSAYAIVWLLLGFSYGLRFGGFLVAFTLAVASLRSWRAMAERRGPRGATRNLLVAPLFGLQHLLLTPVLFAVACATLRKESWGTRQQVEVRLSGS